MASKCQLSNNTKAYIERYHFILNEMIRQMSCAAYTDSISGGFIEQMIPHHRAAIEMSENLLQYTTNIPLQNIALHIISSQKESIENMEEAYPCCRYFLNSPQEVACYQKANERIINKMFYEMKAACTGNQINVNFMREMIPHHMGAVNMSENALRYPLCPELMPLLKEIIVSQKRGIRQMQQLLSELLCR